MISSIVSTELRALKSRGTSGDAIYEMVSAAIEIHHPGGGLLLDVGCGKGLLWPHVRSRFDKYAGADVVRYEGFPDDGTLLKIDLDSGRVPMADGTAEVVAAVETIEHLENPRAFARELTRLCKEGGLIVVTTPNQLSFLSKLTLLVKNSFNAFTNASYPAHITALLEVDLRRIATECGWQQVYVCYSNQSRIPATGRHWPRMLSRLLPRAFSDNICIIGRKR